MEMFLFYSSVISFPLDSWNCWGMGMTQKCTLVHTQRPGSDSDDTAQQYWYDTDMMIMILKVYTCSHSRIRCDRWYWKYSTFYWQFWDATHTEQCVQGIQFNNMDLEGGQFGDSQFFWKCPQCSQLHMSTCRSSDEPFPMVTWSTRLVLPGWPEASNGRSCHLHQLKYKMQPCRVKIS